MAGDISDGQKLIDQMELITSAEFTLQDVSVVDGTGRAAFEAYKKEAEQRLAEEETARRALQMELAEAVKYKTMWESKNDALRDAYEQIENLQRNLEGEQRYVNDLLQEMARCSDKKTGSGSERVTLSTGNGTPTERGDSGVGFSLYKNIQGNYWDNICRNYSDVLRDTLFSELSEIVSNFGAVLEKVIYASAGECLLVEATVGSTSVMREKMQNSVELYSFPQTRTLHESMSTPFRKGTPRRTVGKDSGWARLAEAKERAEMERDEALQVLQEATDELEMIYGIQRQAEERRAAIPGLCDIGPHSDQKNTSTFSSDSQAVSKIPIYVATAEEYEEVVAAMRKAEKERDEVVNWLHDTQAKSVPTTHKSTSTSFVDSQQGRQDVGLPQTVSMTEYLKVVTEKEETKAECREAQRELQGALHELESVQRLNIQAEEELRRKLVMLAYSQGWMSRSKRPDIPFAGDEPLFAGVVKGMNERIDTLEAYTAERGKDITDRRRRRRTQKIEKSFTEKGDESCVASAEGGRSGSRVTVPDIETNLGCLTSALSNHRHNNFTAKEQRVTGSPRSSPWPSAISAQDFSSQKFSRYRCVLGELWIPLVKQYRELVEDIFLMELYRATSISPSCVKCLEFGRDGYSVDVDIYDIHNCEDVNACLRRHKFEVLDMLISLSQGRGTSESNAHEFEETLSSWRRPSRVLERQMRSNGENYRVSKPASSFLDEALAKELDAFRCRRALANNLRKEEETLRSFLISYGDIDPKAAVDTLVLQREPIYCVTLDEYRRVLGRRSASSSRSAHHNHDVNEEQTRLWNEHVVKQAEKERRLARRLSQPYPQFTKKGQTE